MADIRNIPEIVVSDFDASRLKRRSSSSASTLALSSSDSSEDIEDLDSTQPITSSPVRRNFLLRDPCESCINVTIQHTQLHHEKPSLWEAIWPICSCPKLKYHRRQSYAVTQEKEQHICQVLFSCCPNPFKAQPVKVRQRDYFATYNSTHAYF